MKTKFILFISVFLTCAYTNKVNAQLLVSNALSPQQLAELISGPGVKILNPVVHCASTGYGKYNAANSNLNISEGLLLTTGTINNAVGPNNAGNKTTYFGNQNTPSTYPLLNGYTGKTTWEYCEFEFDIIPQGDTIKFDFVFASEEYEEWVGSQYNDVFGFFISGPGITGDPGAGAYHNIALIPNSSTAVTINNVNQNSNTAYYQNNNNGTSVQYDGFTKGLKAISRVVPCDTFHLKLVVADVSDKLWDSGVFIEKITSNNIILLSQTAGGIPNMVEGCNNGQIIFTRPNITSSPLTINYWLAGTATNGTDYPLIGSSPNPSIPKTITIPSGQASASITIDPIDDGINEGNEYITVYLGNPFCASQIMDSIRFYIQDSLYTNVSPIADSICIGGNTVITTIQGGSAFSWLPSAGLNNSAIANPIATPIVSTTYTLTTTASFCSMQRTSTVLVSNMNLALSSTNITCNNANNGTINLSATNGFPPYTYQWSGPNSFTSASQNINSLAPGTYSVTVRDKKGCEKTSTATITEPTALSVSLTSPTVAGGYNVNCNGNSTGYISSSVNGGTQPYTYSWSTSPVQTTSSVSNLTAGVYTLTILDNNNCSVNQSITLTQPNALVSAIASQQNVLCYGNTTGSVTLNTTGGVTPYTYLWNTSPQQSTANAANLSAGTYTATINDVNNCIATRVVTISQPTSALNANISNQINVACFGNATGSATVNTSGGTSPYTYQWNTNPSQTAATALNLIAGNYAVTVKDNNNCETQVAVSITQPSTNVNGTITQTNVSCFGGNNGTASVLASGGVPGYTYNWSTSPAQTSATAINLSSGTYTVLIKDANNCSFNIQTTITQPSAALSSTVTSQTNVLCNGNNTGSATITVSGGTIPYSYSWNTNPAQTSATATNLPAGTYTLTITDSKNCSRQQSVTITQPASSVSATLNSQNNVLCYGTNTGSANAVASGGVSPYTYSWTTSPIQTTATASNLFAGNYTLTVKDANNCTVNVAASITQPSSILGASITSVINVKCKNNATGSASVVATGGSGSYTYSWNSSPAQTTTTANNLVAGNYTVTVSDNNGCTIPVTLPVNISEPLAVLATSATTSSYNSYGISCFGGNNGSIDLTTNGGTSPYSFVWNGVPSFSSSNEDISNLVSGSYSVTITDANNCTTNQNFTLTQPLQLSAATTITSATCPSFNDGEINTISNGGVPVHTYSWAGPSSFNSTNASILGLVAGNYSLTVTDANGCTNLSTHIVTQPGAIAITYTVSVYPGGNNISCYGGNNGDIGSINVSGGTPTYNYLWIGPSGYTSTSPSISSLNAGTYQLLVTDDNNCTASKIVTLTEPNAINNTLTPLVYNGNYNISCNGTSTGSISNINSGGTPAYSYVWNGPSGFSSTNQNISSLEAGTYTLTTSDINSCQGISTITLTQPQILNSVAGSPGVNGGYNITCNGFLNGSIEVNSNGGTLPYIYSWTGPSGFNSSDQNLNSLAAGVYDLLLTDANNCTTTASLTLTEPDLLVANANSPTFAGGYNISCNGYADGSLNLLVTGGTSNYSFNWTGSNAYTSAQQNLSGLSEGSYSVVVTDANNCTAYTNQLLTQPTSLLTSVSSPSFIGGNNISCNGSADGSISSISSGGTIPYIYSWTGPLGYNSNSDTITGLSAGTYSLLLTDANNCIVNDIISLSEPLVMNMSLASPTYAGAYNITCTGFNNGSVILNNNGGIAPYNYNWNGPASFGSADQNPSGLIAGMYYVSITDANGCLLVDSINLTEPIALTGSISSPVVNGGYNITCNGQTNGSVTQIINGGTLPYSYNWNTGDNTANLTNVPAGNYSSIITDANNCTFTQNILLTEPSVLFASANSPTYSGGVNIKCKNDSTGTIALGIVGGTVPYTYVWNGPGSFIANSQDIDSLIAGTYSVTISDLNACTYSTSITLTEADILQTNLNAVTYAGGYNVSCNGYNDGSINSTIGGGTQPYQYTWSGPSGFTNNTSQISSLFQGVYSLTVTDTNACVSFATITLTEPVLLSASANSTVHAGGYNISCNSLSNGDITLNLTGGTSPFTFAWNGPNGFTSGLQNLNSLYAGSYSVSIADANNCPFALNQTLTEPSKITDSISTIQFTGGTNLRCYNSNDGILNLIINGGTSPYTQVWSGPNSFSSNDDSLIALAAGNYYVSITDANACVKTDSLSLSQPTEFIQQLSTSVYTGGFNIRCKNDSSGVIFNTVSGGTPGYNFTWSGPSGYFNTSEDINNVAAGSYTVTATDSNNCVSIATLALTEPLQSMTDTLSSINVACFGNNTGAINIEVEGGTPGYIFYWRGPNDYSSSTQNIDSLYSGLYEAVITDTNGCQLSLSLSINEPAVISSSFTSINPVCKGISNGQIDLTVSGGIMPYSYMWSNGSGNEDLTNIAAGNYHVTFTDANGCKDSLTVSITEPQQLLNIIKNLSGIKCFGDANAGIDIEVNGGISPYIFSWSNGATTQNLNNLTNGMYVLQMTDSNGCQLIDTTLILQPDSLQLSLYSPLQFNSHNISFANGTDGSVDLTASGGTAPYSYLWSNNSNTEDIYNTAAGQYNVIVTDSNGCISSASIVLTEPFELAIPQGFSPNNDGKNDCFVVHGIESYPSNVLTIYNRWGNVVYSQEGYTNKWDGNSINGQELPTGTYFAILEVNNGDIVLKGYVELRR